MSTLSYVAWDSPNVFKVVVSQDRLWRTTAFLLPSESAGTCDVELVIQVQDGRQWKAPIALLLGMDTAL